MMGCGESTFIVPHLFYHWQFDVQLKKCLTVYEKQFQGCHGITI
jgi:hypothetical protein